MDCVALSRAYFSLIYVLEDLRDTEIIYGPIIDEISNLAKKDPILRDELNNIVEKLVMWNKLIKKVNLFKDLAQDEDLDSAFAATKQLNSLKESLEKMRLKIARSIIITLRKIVDMAEAC